MRSCSSTTRTTRRTRSTPTSSATPPATSSTTSTGCYVQIIDDAPVALQLPQSVAIEVIETPPELKGGTATKRPKPAKLTTGIEIMVPGIHRQRREGAGQHHHRRIRRSRRVTLSATTTSTPSAAPTRSIALVVRGNRRDRTPRQRVRFVADDERFVLRRTHDEAHVVVPVRRHALALGNPVRGRGRRSPASTRQARQSRFLFGFASTPRARGRGRRRRGRRAAASDRACGGGSAARARPSRSTSQAEAVKWPARRSRRNGSCASSSSNRGSGRRVADSASQRRR